MSRYDHIHESLKELQPPYRKVLTSLLFTSPILLTEINQAFKTLHQKNEQECLEQVNTVVDAIVAHSRLETGYCCELEFEETYSYYGIPYSIPLPYALKSRFVRYRQIASTPSNIRGWLTRATNTG